MAAFMAFGQENGCQAGRRPRRKPERKARSCGRAQTPLWSPPELLEARLLLAQFEWLSGLVGPDSFPQDAAGQVVYLDFDGGSGITFAGPAAFEGDISPSRLDADAISQVTGIVSSALGALGVTVQTSAPQTSCYSTVYISGGGAFAGLEASCWGVAESADTLNSRPDDRAIVFAGAITAAVGDGQTFEAIAAAAVHEIGHLLGLSHAAGALRPGASESALAAVEYTQGDWSLFTGGAVHQYLTQQAMTAFAEQFGHTELSHYIGGAVTDGSHDEDVAADNPFDDADAHYWGHDASYTHLWNDGYAAQDSAVNRAWKYMTGGRGLDGVYDSSWGNNGGVQDRGILWQYANGYKSQAYYWLGHVAHLLEDMTVPAHANADPHGTDDTSNPWDDYESYIGDGENWKDWNHGDVTGRLRTPDEVFAQVGQRNAMYSLFLENVRLADDFDSDDAAGQYYHVSNGGAVSDSDSHAIGEEMIPQAMKSVAELYRYFFHEIDTSPPEVSISGFSTSQGAPTTRKGRFTVTGAGEDSTSGVDKNSYTFTAWKWNGATWANQQNWSAPDGTNVISVWADGLYRIQVSVVNGGGYSSSSPYYYVSAATVAGVELPLNSKGTATYTDADGDTVTVTLKGAGSGSIYRPSAGSCDASIIILNDTTEKSSLRISVSGAGGGTGVGEFCTNSYPLGAISAPTTDLKGPVTIGPAASAKASAALTFDEISNASITSAMAIKTLTAAQWLDTDLISDVLTAPAVGTLSIKGRRANVTTGAPALRGDFQAHLNLGTSSGTAKALGSLSVAGVLDHSIITARGADAKGLSVGSFRAGLVGSATVTSDGGIGSVSTSQWQDGDIHAGWIGAISTKMDWRLLGAGNFAADMTLGGASLPAKKAALGKVSIDGDLRGAYWSIAGSMGAMIVRGTVGWASARDAVTVRTTGSMGALSFGAASRADFLAGIAEPVPGDPFIRRADRREEFTSALASIKSVTIKPAKGQVGLFLADSNFSAASVGAVKIVNAKFNNDQFGLNETQDDFGIWALAVKSVKHTDTTDPKNAAKNWTWKPGAVAPAGLEDLNIQPLV